MSADRPTFSGEGFLSRGKSAWLSAFILIMMGLVWMADGVAYLADGRTTLGVLRVVVGPIILSAGVLVVLAYRTERAKQVKADPPGRLNEPARDD